MFSSWVMVFKLSKKVHFLQFCPELSMKPKSIKTIYIMHLKGLVMHFHKIILLILLLCYDLCFRDIRVWSRKILLSFCWVSTFFDTLIGDISWVVAQTLINQIIFWKSVMRTLRYIYVNCFNRLRFLAEVCTKLQKIHFFGQVKDHNLGRKHGN